MVYVLDIPTRLWTFKFLAIIANTTANTRGSHETMLHIVDQFGALGQNLYVILEE